jgi:hypothetical protein
MRARHASPDARDTAARRGSGMSRHANTQAARDAAVLLRTSGCTPESVAQRLRAAAEGNGNVAVPAPRDSGDTRQAAS